jgi:hypothetical protein
MAAMLAFNPVVGDPVDYCEGMLWKTISALPLPVPLRRKFVASARAVQPAAFLSAPWMRHGPFG